MGRRSTAWLLLTACLPVALAQATPGDLDPTFGTGGVVTTPVGAGSDVGYAIALQPDGRIVVAGHASNGVTNDFAVLRYDAGGVLDPTFGTGGVATTSLGTTFAFYGADVAIQPDGRIVGAGYALGAGPNDIDFLVVRWLDGTPDPGFGIGGS